MHRALPKPNRLPRTQNGACGRTRNRYRRGSGDKGSGRVFGSGPKFAAALQDAQKSAGRELMGQGDTSEQEL